MGLFQSTLAIVFTLIGTSAFANPGDLVSIEHMFEQPSDLADFPRLKACPAAREIPRDYGYNAYRITYRTNTVSGQEVNTNGLLIIPRTTGPMPVVVYQHGTVFGRKELPSNYNFFQFGEAMAIANCFGTAGYISILADYLGFGDGTGPHPYLHADSEARFGRDMMRASFTALQHLAAEFDGHLFVMGYSQGGHSAMSLMRMLEQDPAHEFQVTAAAPMAGPYDLPGTMPSVLNSPTEHSSAEMAYILVGLNPIYGFYGDLVEAIRPEYVAKVATLFDGTKTWSEALKALPMKPDELVQPAFLNLSMKDNNSVFLRAMDVNANYQWVPRTPMRLYHGGGDKDVPFENSQRAYEYFKSHGADVELVNLGDDVDHTSGPPYAFGLAELWFETFLH